MSKRKNSNWINTREAAFDRDQHQCVNCLGTKKEEYTLDPDHCVPRGVGGSDRLSNINTLCRRCHNAKHDDGLAPTIRWKSTGDMTSTEFDWFRHFIEDMLPVMAQEFNIRMIPKFGLAEKDAWHIPLGDLRRLDQQLLEAHDQYPSFQVHQYM